MLGGWKPIDNAKTPKQMDFARRILSTCVRQPNRIAKEHAATRTRLLVAVAGVPKKIRCTQGVVFSVGYSRHLHGGNKCSGATCSVGREAESTGVGAIPAGPGSE
jgi:hypothetical protein